MLDAEQKIYAIACGLARDRGISVAKAYAEAVKENPALYQAYLDERENAMLTSQTKREYMARMQQRFAGRNMGTVAHVSQNHLPA